MQFKSTNYDDIRKYYLGTYIKVKEHGDKLFRIDRVDRTQVSGMVDDGREFVLYMNETDPYEIDYVLPHKSYFQFGTDACQLFRVPARQYRRGICTDNTRIQRISPSSGKPENLGDLTFEVLQAFVAKQPFATLTSAVSAGAGQNSVVLTPRMAYNRHNKCIYIDMVKVAAVDGSKKTIHMIQPIFKSEIVNFLSKSSEQFTVQ